MSLKIPISQEDEDLPLPEYATEGSSGVDLHASIKGDKLIMPDETRLIDTGIRIALMEGYEGQVRSRSSIAQEGVIIPNSPGTIDSDYRGEIKVMLRNLNKSPFRIQRGDRIAQLVIQQVEHVNWYSIDSLSDTKRSDGGFGSTGRSG